MEVPLQITFKNLEPSDAVADRVKERTSWLERFYPRITSCRVTIIASRQRSHARALYGVRVDLRVPGRQIAISRNPDLAKEHYDVYVAIRDVFDAARRELEDYARTQRLDTKRLEKPPRGRVVRLFYGDGKYGFIQTEAGRELYFHSNSVLNGHFDQLQVGTEVRFAEEKGESGPQASTVEILGKIPAEEEQAA